MDERAAWCAAPSASQWRHLADCVRSPEGAAATSGRKLLQALSEPSTLLPTEDVEVFFKNLDRPAHSRPSDRPPYPLPHPRAHPLVVPSSSAGVAAIAAAAAAAAAARRPHDMFPNAMTSAMTSAGMYASPSGPPPPPTYHPHPHPLHDAASASFLAASSPLYVPTTRAVLPPPSAAAGVSPYQPAPVPTPWPGDETAPSAYSPMPQQRFAFQPAATPSPAGQGGARRDGGYATPLGTRPAGLSPYGPYVSAELAAPWNTFSQSMPLGAQAGLVRGAGIALGKTRQSPTCKPQQYN